MQPEAPLLSVKGLKTWFHTFGGVVKAVDGVSFDLAPGEILGIVGESGGGKSMIGFSIMGLVDRPGRIEAGEIIFDGRDLAKLDDDAMQAVRGRQIAMIFQDPMTALNPLYTIGNQLEEMLTLHTTLGAEARRARCVEMLAEVGIPQPEDRLNAYPHQFSGGMRQRVMIAMALACNPGVLIADEPTTALDVTVQAQIFDLISDLRSRTGTAVVLITHDMGAIAEMTDRVAVMYAGRIVEEGTVAEVLEHPLHPYTQGLIACAPGRRTAAHGEPLEEIPGTVPSLLERRGGCAFADRCSHVMPRCRIELPAETRLDGGQRRVLCWLHAEHRP